MLGLKNGIYYNTQMPDVNQMMQEREVQVREWNKRKDKHYYRVPMLNGGQKYVYMCEDMVKDFYGRYGYSLA